MATNTRLALYVALFVLFWAASLPPLVKVSVPCILWAIGRAVTVRGPRALLVDIPNRLRVVRHKPAEILFLLSVPALVAAAYFVAPELKESVLIIVSFIFAATHAPQALMAADRGTVKRAVVTAVLGLVVAVLVAQVDVRLSVWTSAVLDPQISKCSRGGHPLRAEILELAERLHSVYAVRMLREYVEPVIVKFGKLGEVPLHYTALLLMYAWGELATASPRARRYLQVPLAAVVYGGIISASMKIVIHRERPMLNGNPFVFTGPSTTWKNSGRFSKVDLSFPSGHAVVTMATAQCLIRLWMRDFCSPTTSSKIGFMARGLPMYLLAGVVALSRFSRCMHWASDCAAGAALGILVADALVVGPMLRHYVPFSKPEPELRSDAKLL